MPAFGRVTSRLRWPQGCPEAVRGVRQQLLGEIGIGFVDDGEVRIPHQGNPFENADGTDDQGEVGP